MSGPSPPCYSAGTSAHVNHGVTALPVADPSAGRDGRSVEGPGGVEVVGTAALPKGRQGTLSARNGRRQSRLRRRRPLQFIANIYC